MVKSIQIKALHSFPHFRIMDAIYPTCTIFPKHIDFKNRISIILQGTLKEVACGKEVFAKTGNIVFKPRDVVHTNSFGKEVTRIVSVEFDDHFLEKNIATSIDDWLWFCQPTLAAMTLRFAQNLTRFNDKQHLLEDILEIYGALPMKGKKSALVPSWMTLIEEKIQDEYATVIQSKSLANMVGVHPVYLARVFRRIHRCSIKTYLHRIRLNRALQELNNSDKPLTHIALDAGFADQSHFNRIFKQHISVSPGNFRKWAKKY